MVAGNPLESWQKMAIIVLKNAIIFNGKQYKTKYSIMYIMRGIFASLIAFLPLTLGFQNYLTPFQNWLDTYKQEFSSEEHFYDVLRKWVTNELYIKRINRENRSYKLAHNQFSGMDEFDFKRYLNTNKYEFIQVNEYKTMNRTFAKLPESVNWVEAGAVTPVKDQGQCGSCWSFSTTGAMEGAYFVKYGKLESFSEQQLVDCDNLRNGGRDHGCNGGLMNNAFSWIEKNGGICTEDEYPYISSDGSTESCETSCREVPNSAPTGFENVLEGDDYFMEALTQQPVSIAIEADQRDFQLYSSGVFTGTCGTNLDHGVLAVGYGTENGNDYYLVKNSWSSSWGDNGYIKLGRGSEYNDGQGQCGILMQASYPVL